MNIHRNKQVKTWAATELNPDVEAGDIVDKYGYQFVWSDNHLNGQQLEQLRKIGDPLVDEVLPRLKRKITMKFGCGVYDDTNLDTTVEFARQDKLQNKFDTPEVKLATHIYNLPDWVDFEQIARGQLVFWTYLPFIMSVLLYGSLVGGFASNRIVSTLSCTGYLTDSKRSWLRICETALMVLDVMLPNSLKINGRGWRSVLNVRFMHANVRNHVCSLPRNRYDVEKLGIPINQEDLLATGVVFSIGVLEGLQRLGISLSTKQQQDYMSVWRLVFYYMGIDDLIHFESAATALTLRQGLIMHTLDPNDESKKIAMNVIKASSYKPPFFRSTSAAIATTRILLGDGWADSLGLQSKHTSWYVYVATLILSMYLPINRSLFFGYLSIFGAQRSTEIAQVVAYSTLKKYLQENSKSKFRPLKLLDHTNSLTLLLNRNDILIWLGLLSVLPFLIVALQLIKTLIF